MRCVLFKAHPLQKAIHISMERMHYLGACACRIRRSQQPKCNFSCVLFTAHSKICCREKTQLRYYYYICGTENQAVAYGGSNSGPEWSVQPFALTCVCITVRMRRCKISFLGEHLLAYWASQARPAGETRSLHHVPRTRVWGIPMTLIPPCPRL